MIGLLSLINPIEWLARLRQRSGFGVQSPYAYRFMQDVVKGGGTYYAFADLRAERRSAPLRDKQNSRRVDEFLFRLTNFVQPVTIFVQQRGTGISRRYMAAARKSASIYTYQTSEDLQNTLKVIPKVDFLYVDGKTDYADILNAASPFLTPTSVVIVKHIRHNDTVWRWWRSMVDNRNAGLSFDLRGFGLLFSDTHYAKQDFKAFI